MRLYQVYLGFWGTILFASYFIFGNGFDDKYISVLSGISMLNMLFFDFIVRKRLPSKGLFSCSTLFMISYAIVFFQFTFLVPFYPEIAENDLYWGYGDQVNWVTMIASCSIHLFMMGYIEVLCRRAGRFRKQLVAVANCDKLRKLLYFLPAVSIFIFGIFLAMAGRGYLSGAYGGSANWGGGASHFYKLFEVFFYLTVALEIYKIRLLNPNAGTVGYITSFNVHTLGFIGFFVLFNLYVGDRGPVISTILILVGGYDFLFRRLPYLISIACIVFGVIVMSFLSEYRSKDASLSIQEKVDKGKRKSEDKKFYEYTEDLAASVRIMNYAVMVTPEPSSYYYGWVQLGRFTGVVPMLSGVFRTLPIRVHNTPLGASSSSIFTYHVLGPNSQIGVGSSIVADLYIDFGVFGSFAGMFLFGCFIAWVEVRATNSIGLFRVVFYLLVVINALYWPRSFIGIAYQQWFLSLVSLYFIYKYYFQKTRRPELPLKLR
jgi:hypothetical protein